MKNLKKSILVSVLITVMLVAFAAQPVYAEQSSSTGGEIVGDLLIVRPLSIAGTAVGCVLFVVALPFTVWDKDEMKRVGQKLVVEPGKYSFERPLGDF